MCGGLVFFLVCVVAAASAASATVSAAAAPVLPLLPLRFYCSHPILNCCRIAAAAALLPLLRRRGCRLLRRRAYGALLGSSEHFCTVSFLLLANAYACVREMFSGLFTE